MGAHLDSPGCFSASTAKEAPDMSIFSGNTDTFFLLFYLPNTRRFLSWRHAIVIPRPFIFPLLSSPSFSLLSPPLFPSVTQLLTPLISPIFLLSSSIYSHLSQFLTSPDIYSNSLPYFFYENNLLSSSFLPLRLLFTTCPHFVTRYITSSSPVATSLIHCLYLNTSRYIHLVIE